MTTKTLCLFLSLLCSLIAYTQQATVDWFPVGARWEYAVHSFNHFGDCSAQVEKDTLIQGRSCKVITTDCVPDEPVFYLCPEEDKVYRFAEEAFHILYDFSAQVGDTITVWVPYAGIGSTFDSHIHSEVVDSIGNVVLGNQIYRAYWTRDLIDLGSSFSFLLRPIVERIGDLDFILPQFLEVGVSPLLQYNDSCTTIQLQDNCLDCWYDIQERCDTMTAVKEILNKRNPIAYPVPADNQLTIKNLPESSTSYIIYNETGQPVTPVVERFGDVDINTSRFKNGIYFIQLFNQHNFCTLKFNIFH